MSSDKRAEEAAEAYGRGALCCDKSFLAGVAWRDKHLLKGDFEVLGLKLEQIAKLKNFFELHTGMRSEEYGGALVDSLVKRIAGLEAELSTYKSAAENYKVASQMAREAGKTAMTEARQILKREEMLLGVLREIHAQGPLSTCDEWPQIIAGDGLREHARMKEKNG